MIKSILARVAFVIETLIERVRPRRAGGSAWVDAYTGYATPDHLIVRGRVLQSAQVVEAQAAQSKLRNLWQMLSRFRTHEIAGASVSVAGTTVQTDEEGYFTAQLPRSGRTGRVEVPVAVDTFSTHCAVIVPDAAATRGVISDIDDTMIETGAFSLWRNIWTSLTGNALSRHVFADAVTLMSVLQAGGNPVFFVSSSPWNFHGFLKTIFTRAGLPDAPVFLRDYGVSKTQFITGTHGDHKGGAIATILAACPDLEFVLIGDTGQHDAAVYLAAITANPGRISHVILRTAGKVDDKDRASMTAIEKTGVPVFCGADYKDAIAHFS